MRALYANPPLIEAVCDFRFEPGEPWDATIPGRLYVLLEKQFPKRRAIRDFTAEIVAGPNTIEQQVTPIDRTHFVREDETALVQVAVNNLTVNHLAPYPGWATFRPMIERALKTYNQIAVPQGLQRIGLRYINRVEIPGRRVNLEEYFDFYPHVGSGFSQIHGEFIAAVTFPYRDGHDSMRVQLNELPTGEGDRSIFTLDLDYFLNRSGGVSLAEATHWIEEAHQHVEEGFEAAIRQPLRERFNAGEGA